MPIAYTVADDISKMVLAHYLRGSALAQTLQERPLLNWIKANQKTFPGGNLTIKENIRGAFMSDTAGFLQGYANDDQLVFPQGALITQSSFTWYEVAANLRISWTELKKDGVTITDDNNVSKHSGMELDRISSILEERMSDFGESYARALNSMFWADGTQDAKQVPGIQALFPGANNVATIGGIDQSQAANAFWRHRVNLAVPTSEAGQELTKFLRAEMRQLKRYGGRPNKAFAGDAFIKALESEVQAKGHYTDSGFTAGQDLGMGNISLRGLGTFEYDPSLDDLGFSDRCYVFDSRRVRARVMDGEDSKMLNPTRPYDYLMFFKTITWTGAMTVSQMNCNGVYAVAAQ
jgi:hypothetical protein